MPHQNPGLALLEALEDGRFAEDLDNQVREVVGALRRHVTNAGGKPKAKLTITLTLADDGKHVEVNGGIRTTLPTPVRQRSILWRAEGDTLSPVNPHQLDMLRDAPAAAPLRDVPAGAAPVRDISTARAAAR